MCIRDRSYCVYKIDGVAVERKDLVSDVRFLMDSKLLFPQYVESFVFKACRNLGRIKWIGRHVKSTDSCVTFYNSLVRSHLEYTSVIWNRNCEYTVYSIEWVQRTSYMANRFNLLGHDVEVTNTVGLPALLLEELIYTCSFYIEFFLDLLDVIVVWMSLLTHFVLVSSLWWTCTIM